MVVKAAGWHGGGDEAEKGRSVNGQAGFVKIMAEAYGSFGLVLHFHLPYVLSHDRLEEEWLFEAVAESYLPLLQTFYRLILQGMSLKITLGLTPVLLDQLADPRFSHNFLAYLEEKSRAAQNDRRDFKESDDSHLARLAGQWDEFYRRAAAFFADDLSTDLVGALRRLQEGGQVELLASAATHAYLPLLGLDESVRTQIELGIAYYEHCFGTRPQGFWLPECGYRPASHWTPPLEGIELTSSDRQAIDQLSRQLWHSLLSSWTVISSKSVHQSMNSTPHIVCTGWTEEALPFLPHRSPL
jgi:predicted glycosyl hydrolase (DUF1957 family)